MINFPTASESRQNCSCLHEEAMNYCLNRIRNRINEANKMGERHTCFVPTIYHYNDETGYRCSLDIESELKDFLRGKGYTFRPTGYIGGDWQLSEEICW